MAKGVALAWDLIARDGASPTFNRVAVAADRAAASTRKAETGVAGFGKRAVAALGALATIDFAVHAVKDAAAFESAMMRIHTVVGASTAEVKNMSKAMLGLAGEVAQSPEKLAVSLYHMEAIGLRGADALDAVKAAAEGAKIGNADLEETTNALTATIQSGIAGNQSFTKTMSQLLTIVGTGDMKLQDFNEALGSGLLAVMANAGVSLRDVGAALAVFGDNNIRGADAATMLRVAVQAMQAPAKGGAKALASIGLNAHSLKDDLLKGGLNAAISDLRKHLDDAGQGGKRAGALLVEAFGKKANTGIGVLIHEFDLLEKKYGIIDKNTDNFGQKWKDTTKTAAFALDRLRAEFEVVAITVGTKLIPPVTAVVNFLTQDIGPKLVAPWHALDDVLSIVGAAVSGIGSVLGALHIPLGGITIAVLGAFAAFKVMGAVFLPGGLLDGMVLRLMYAKDAVVGLGTSAVVAGGEVAEGGAAAAIGWRGLLGPLVAIGVGIALLSTMFHKSAASSREATEATKAYADALKTVTTAGQLHSTIIEQLTDNNIPEKINAVNKALGRTAFTAEQFAGAVQNGGPQLHMLQGQLLATARHFGLMSDQGKAAVQLIADLNSQTKALADATKKDLTDTAAFAGVSSSIDKVSQSTNVGTDTAKKYAAMSGIVVDKLGVAAVSAKTLAAAIKNVGGAYNTASTAGAAFLDALSTFASSSGSAADRAALIGATLKAANGDALNFAAALNAGAAAEQTFGSNVKDAAKKAKQSTRDYLASVVNLKTGTIDYHKTAAGPLIADLQAIQAAGMNAAQAEYQHARATMSGKDAADQAYKVYVGQTRGALIDQLEKLGANSAEAKRLADRYLGMPKKVKTLIEQEGANPVVDVLNQIGKQLAYLTGHPWIPTIGINDKASHHLAVIQAHIEKLHGKTVVIDAVYNTDRLPGKSSTPHPFAAGGSVGDGYFTVGEQGPELGRKQGSKVEIFPNSHPKTRAALAGQPKQQGGGVYIAEQNLTVQYPLEGGLSEALKELSRLSARKIREASIAGRAV